MACLVCVGLLTTFVMLGCDGVTLPIDDLLNELARNSPREFANSFEKLVNIKLLKCPSYHRFEEIKATRDIYMHNRGVTNEVYYRKAGSHARAKLGNNLPVDNVYFMESYEYCLQLCEWLEKQLHDKWHSSEHEQREKKKVGINYGPSE